jgi:hypothetical protein
MVIEAAIEPYMRCTALLIRSSEQVAPDVVEPAQVRLGDAVPEPFFPVPYEVGYHTAMEVRFSTGSFRERGPATAWMRMRVPLVDGEEPSPLTRVLVAADSGNGVSSVLDFEKYLFVNADLTVHLVRYPAGEWVCLEAVTSVDSTGVGLADTALHDERGRIGRSVQSLLVGPR